MRDTVRHWFASKWLAPNAFKRKALVDTLHGLYIPYWTFDARVHCPWRAEAGHYYYEKQGNNQVRRVRWTPASGVIDHFFDDLLIPGHQGHRPRPARAGRAVPDAGPAAVRHGLPLGSRRRAVPGDPRGCRRAGTGAHAGGGPRRCASRQIPGDTYQNLQMSPTWSGRTFKHVLVPVYVMTYVYGRRPYQVVVNASNGRMGGTYPISWVKVALIIIAILIVLAIVNR